MTDENTTPNAAPAGWYDDPEVEGGKRYWDGEQWTEQRDVQPTPAPPGGQPPPGDQPIIPSPPQARETTQGLPGPKGAPKGVQLAEGEEVIMSLRPCPSGSWYLYPITLGLWEMWRQAKSYTLTNHRIIEKKGIFSKSDSSLPLFYVQDASLKTWFFPRWGKIAVSTAGEVGGFTSTMWLRREEGRKFREEIVQSAQHARQTEGDRLRPGASPSA